MQTQFTINSTQWTQITIGVSPSGGTLQFNNYSPVSLYISQTSDPDARGLVIPKFPIDALYVVNVPESRFPLFLRLEDGATPITLIVTDDSVTPPTRASLFSKLKSLVGVN